jgi:hypothetical protein
VTIAARTLHVDRSASATHHASSLEEAIVRLVSGEEYDAIVLHRHGADWDEYGLVAYLGGTWPQFLRGLTIRSVAQDGVVGIWNAASSAFEREAPVRRPRGFRESPRRGRIEAAVDGT